VPNNASGSATVTLSCTPTGGTVSPGSGTATEALPASFTVTGYDGNPTCTATESPIPTGYASTGTCSASLTTGTCTITNTLRSATLTVAKDFVPNAGGSVTVTVSCTSGTPSPASGSASEATSFVTTVTGFNAGATCNASEGTAPAGYTKNEAACQNVPISDGGAASCTITNNLNVATFTVAKDFVPNNGGSVTVSLSCSPTGGTASPASASASEATPASFTVSGYDGNPTCTATESPVPTGWTSTATCSAALSAGTCTITNNQTSATLTVIKDFVPNNAASVTINVSCSSGTPSPASGSASEATSFLTTVTQFGPSTTCSATEGTAPGGYAKNEAACQNVAISNGGNSTCTITNTQNNGNFTVVKDFVPNNGGSVTVSLSCSPTGGTAAPASASASEATPASFTVTGYTGNPTCTATESPVPTGWTSTATCSAALSAGTCTITNNQTSATLTVIKDFVPNNAASVTINVSCTSGTPSPASGSAAEGSPFTTTVTQFGPSTTCSATEGTAPGGYTKNEAACQNVAISNGGTPSCTITNTQTSATFLVKKNFVPDNPSGSVTVMLSCSPAGGTASPASATATEAVPASFTVSGYTGTPTCTATESPIPTGYSSTGTCSATLTAGECTIVNNLRSATLTVAKDFIPDNGSGSASVSVSCTSGTPSPASGTATESASFVTTVTGFNVGATCTATETPISGYNANQANCLNVAITDGGSASCTITNTAVGSFTVNKDWSDDRVDSVTVTLACGAGTVTPPTGSASEQTPASFTVTGVAGSQMCTATEGALPSGYTSTGTCSATLAAGTCTLLNKATATFQVVKDFVPNNAALVSVSINCTSGTVSPGSANAQEGTPASFTVTGYGPGAQSCTATETAVPGYTSTGTCTGAITNHAGTCTITNTLITPSPSPTPSPTLPPTQPPSPTPTPTQPPTPAPTTPAPTTVAPASVTPYPTGGAVGGFVDIPVVGGTQAENTQSGSNGINAFGLALFLLAGFAAMGGATVWVVRRK
jgi:hypothetical protein